MKDTADSGRFRGKLEGKPVTGKRGQEKSAAMNGLAGEPH